VIAVLCCLATRAARRGPLRARSTLGFMRRQARSQPPRRAEPPATRAYANSAGSEALALISAGGRRADPCDSPGRGCVLGVYMVLGNTSAALDHLQAALDELSYVSSGRLRATRSGHRLREDVRFRHLIALN
jgi:hypothetical protein